MSLFDLLFIHIAERWLWAWQRTAASVNFARSSCTIKKEKKVCSVVWELFNSTTFKNKWAGGPVRFIGHTASNHDVI